MSSRKRTRGQFGSAGDEEEEEENKDDILGEIDRYQLRGRQQSGPSATKRPASGSASVSFARTVPSELRRRDEQKNIETLEREDRTREEREALLQRPSNFERQAFTYRRTLDIPLSSGPSSSTALPRTPNVSRRNGSNANANRFISSPAVVRPPSSSDAKTSRSDFKESKESKSSGVNRGLDSSDIDIDSKANAERRLDDDGKGGGEGERVGGGAGGGGEEEEEEVLASHISGTFNAEINTNTGKRSRKKKGANGGSSGGESKSSPSSSSFGGSSSSSSRVGRRGSQPPLPFRVDEKVQYNMFPRKDSGQEPNNILRHLYNFVELLCDRTRNKKTHYTSHTRMEEMWINDPLSVRAQSRVVLTRENFENRFKDYVTGTCEEAIGVALGLLRDCENPQINGVSLYTLMRNPTLRYQFAALVLGRLHTSQDPTLLRSTGDVVIRTVGAEDADVMRWFLVIKRYSEEDAEGKEIHVWRAS